ncbi:hypothetical protein BKA69DRAFT_1167232 [Paraphysoderma sedebokerense]|nr:hypothetical protein BKA69DRAFT_1167232 [Paraphysoderma sedebokerense]
MSNSGNFDIPQDDPISIVYLGRNWFGSPTSFTVLEQPAVQTDFILAVKYQLDPLLCCSTFRFIQFFTFMSNVMIPLVVISSTIINAIDQSPYRVYLMAYAFFASMRIFYSVIITVAMNMLFRRIRGECDDLTQTYREKFTSNVSVVPKRNLLIPGQIRDHNGVAHWTSVYVQIKKANSTEVEALR